MRRWVVLAVVSVLLLAASYGIGRQAGRASAERDAQGRRDADERLANAAAVDVRLWRAMAEQHLDRVRQTNLPNYVGDAAPPTAGEALDQALRVADGQLGRSGAIRLAEMLVCAEPVDDPVAARLAVWVHVRTAR